MDVVTALLDAPRARGASVRRVTLAAPWAVWIRDVAPLTLVAVVSGTACHRPGKEPVQLGAGDLLLITSPDPVLLDDRADRVGPADPPPPTVILPRAAGEVPAAACRAVPEGRGTPSVTTGHDSLLVGSYPSVSEAGARLLRGLPPTLVVRASEHRSALIDVVAAELDRAGVGQACVLDRLLDSLTVTALRHWAASPGAEPPSWLRVAGADPVVGVALDLMHDQTSYPWTVAALARRAGMSRAGFSRRFAAVVGESPMAYLTAWRLAVAADQLRHGVAPVSNVAREVGYASPFTFSTAFKRHYGLSPLAYRQQGELTACSAGDSPRERSTS